MDLFARLVSVGWIDRIKSEFSKKEIESLRKQYFQPGISKEFKPRTHTMICTRAHSLAESVFVLGGTKKEIHQALEYLLICLDCEKYYLDWKKYREDHNIRALEKKYHVHA